MRSLSILGSTGSIGTQALDVVREQGGLSICALAAGHNIDKLEAQAREFRPGSVSVWDHEQASILKTRLADISIPVYEGMDGLIAAAEAPDADIVLASVVGMIGILPAVCAIRAGKDLALANKETLVTAGHIIMPLAEDHHVRVLPVDSEHSAVFQVLQGEDHGGINKILLTCSGGPFRGMTLSQMKDMRPEDALKHPNWSMGRKITVDSATLANKGLEVMEARWLFGTDIDDIQVVIQPKSVIHSMVEFKDGAVLAQLGTPDMRLPISYALYYPERKALSGDRLDFTKLKQIEFDVPDMTNFPALGLALEAGRAGGSLPTVFNAANEWAVDAFLNRRIGFTDIAASIERAMRAHTNVPSPSLDEILACEADTRAFLQEGR